MNWEVIGVKPMDDYKLSLIFKDGSKRVYDVKPLLEKGVFRTLKDPAMFRTVRVAFDSIEWANEVDIAPETLYSDSETFDEMKLAI